MTQEYYIVLDNAQHGPYDMVSLVRKIRNGSVIPGTAVQRGEASIAKPAQEWPELAEFFAEKREDHPSASEAAHAHHRSLSAMLRTGWHFLQRNQYSTVFSGLFVLIIILMAAVVTVGLPSLLRPVAFIVCFVLSHFLLSCYLLVILRLARGQPVDATYLTGKIGPAAKSLFLSSLLISIPALIGLILLTMDLPFEMLMVGLAIFAVIGLYTLALYAFAPLLILDQGYGVWEAMGASRKSVMRGGMERTGVIYAFFVINFLGGLCVLLPMAITLPITMGALVEMYDESFS